MQMCASGSLVTGFHTGPLWMKSMWLHLGPMILGKLHQEDVLIRLDLEQKNVQWGTQVWNHI